MLNGATTYSMGPVAHLGPGVWLDEPSESAFRRGLDEALCAPYGIGIAKISRQEHQDLLVMGSYGQHKLAEELSRYTGQIDFDCDIDQMWRSAIEIAHARDAWELMFSHEQHTDTWTEQPKERRRWRKAIMAFVAASQRLIASRQMYPHHLRRKAQGAA